MRLIDADALMELNNNVEFIKFPKIPRLNREIVITEKIDGTNAQIYISEDGGFYVASRNRWITPDNDNAGFAKWAYENKDDLMQLGTGRHYGEWWGQNIQRNYGLTEKRFSLFNVAEWGEERPNCCHVVPILYTGPFTTEAIEDTMENLRRTGSIAAEGYMNPEGIVVYHTALNGYFKVTLENDEFHKGELSK